MTAWRLRQCSLFLEPSQFLIWAIICPWITTEKQVIQETCLQNLWSNSKKMTLHTLFDLLCYVSGEQLNEWLSSELEFIVGMNQMYYRNSYIFLIGKSE